MRLPLLLALLVLCVLPAAAQDADAYRDAGARELVRLARARRAVVDTRITAYEVTARERISARLAVAGVERLLFRRETAARIHWTRDTVRIEVLGAREAQPAAHRHPQLPPPDLAATVPALAFDPVDSEMLLRFDSTVIRHPLARGSEAHYRFSSGDSTSIRLPGGRGVRLLELRIAARRADPRLINGSFWVDAETHAVVRAGFRLSRPFSSSGSGVSVLTPEVTSELDHVAIDYGFLDLRWWLPRTVVARGVVRAAGMRVPLAYERSYEGYRVEGDTLAGAPPAEAALAGVVERPCRPLVRGSLHINVGGRPDSARAAARDSAWNAAWDRTAARVAAGDSATSDTERGCDRAFLVTKTAGADLVDSPAFPASVYDEDEGPVGAEELEQLAGLVRGLPEVPWSVARPGVQLLTPELLRFNRVEGFSMGARAVLPLGPAELRGELRAGTTGEVGARLSGVRSSPSLRTEVAAYRGIEAVEVASQPFSLAGSASALLLGRDENDYFRGTGAELRLSPPPARRRSWDLRLFAERQEPVRARSDLSLRGLVDGDFETRANLAAERLDQAGATLRLRAARGDDPAGLRTRAELELHGETGDRTFARPLLRLGADGFLGGGVGFGVGLAAGTGLGDLSAQRAWQIGGATTVRGHDPASLRGESLWLGRGELNWGSPALRLSLFGDAGWAGESEDLRGTRPLRGAGVGVSLLDNLLRVDLARGIGGGGFRLHLRMGAGL
ncbi:MAG TPA: ShlB/FhaC/HecB family hemolysin secretion/activation protein [Longimicrobiaceae bacterium]